MDGIVGEAIRMDTDADLLHLWTWARRKNANCVLGPVRTDDEFIAHKDPGDATQMGDRIQMPLSHWIEDIHSIVGGVGNVNVATRWVHRGVIEASRCAVRRQRHKSNML